MYKISEIGLYNYLLESKNPALKENVTYTTLKKGQELYGPLQRKTDIYEIMSGAVKLGNISAKEEEYIYEILAPGEFFGNLAMLEDSFSEFCKAMCATQIRVYNHSFFKHIMTHDPNVAEWCFGKIVFRWNKTESLLAYIRSLEPRERIQHVYADLNKIITTAGNRKARLGKLLTYKNIADLTATTRQLVADTIK